MLKDAFPKKVPRFSAHPLTPKFIGLRLRNDNLSCDSSGKCFYQEEKRKQKNEHPKKAIAGSK